MEKKIIAVALAFVVVITAVIVGVVVNNNKRENFIDDDGVGHWLYKDKEGNTKLNDDGEIVVYALDENGKRQKNKNGDYIMGAIDFPDKVINGNTLETPDFKMTMPKEWKLKDSGMFVLKDNSDVQVAVSVTELEETITIDEYITELLDGGDEVIATLKEKYPKFERNIGSGVMTLKKHDCRIVEYKLAKEEGKTEYYIYGIYFIQGEKLYNISLTCFDNSYDEYAKDIDLMAIADMSFSTKVSNDEQK